MGQKKLYPPTFLLTLAILFKLTQKFLWIMAAAGSDDNNNIRWTTQMKKFCFEKYFEVKSYKAISENFTHLSNHKPPYQLLIIYWVSKFSPFGTAELLIIYWVSKFSPFGTAELLIIYWVSKFSPFGTAELLIIYWVSKFSPFGTAELLITYWVSKFSPFGTAENFNRKIPDRQSHSGRKGIWGEVLKD